MTQLNSPFIDTKYGWLQGESNWNLGMDENLLKFSFLFDRNVDGIVSSLPAAVNGQAYYLTTDNKLYFAVGSIFYSTPVPKWFVIQLRSNGNTYQFDGVSLLPIESISSIDSRLDAVELLVTTSSANLANIVDTAKGSSLVGYLPPFTDAVGRTLSNRLQDVISPKDFGAVGDGVTNDGPALNKALAYIRSKLVSSNVGITLDLSGKTYATDISLNATGLNSWGWVIKNGTIFGRCTGKSVLDTIGSRGGVLKNLVIDGSQTQVPVNGIQAARSGTGAFAFCDNMLWDNVTTQGYFSLAGVHTYGQETTTYHHCRFWNYNKDGFAAIHTGFSSFAMNSDYLAPITGATSYINNKYINCDYRFLPVGKTVLITGISKAASAVVTASGHPFVNGDVVVITQVGGMTEINNLSATVSAVTATTFTLTGVNSTGFGTFTSGGFAMISQTRPTVYLSRLEQHHFDTCYIVNYGTHSVQIDYIDITHTPKSIWLDCLFEGAGSISHVQFTNVSGVRVINDFKLITYNIHARDYVIGHTGTGSDIVSMYTSEIVAQNRSVGSATLLDAYTKFAIYDANVSTANTGMFSAVTMGASFVGKSSWLDGITTIYNNKFVSVGDGTYTPVVTAESGTLTSYTATGVQKSVGDFVFVNSNISITNNGTGAVSLQFTLPRMPAFDAILKGRLTTGATTSLQCIITAGSLTCRVLTDANAYPVVTGSNIKVSGLYIGV